MMQHTTLHHHSSHSQNPYHTEMLVLLWSLMGGCRAMHLEAPTVSSDFPQQQAVVQAVRLLKEQAQLELPWRQAWHHTALLQVQVLVVVRTGPQRRGPVVVQKAHQQQVRGWLQRVHLVLLVMGRRIILLRLGLLQAGQRVLQLQEPALQRAHQRQELVQVHQTNLLLRAQVLLQRQELVVEQLQRQGQVHQTNLRLPAQGLRQRLRLVQAEHQRQELAPLQRAHQRQELVQVHQTNHLLPAQELLRKLEQVQAGHRQ
mmetsp:Transcript_12836/g.27870  ORF Transcript_12836/g.27870 Transcript_12836/m.27870 type:complete len:258 (+) Transcript_12836:1535-2308(+)